MVVRSYPRLDSRSAVILFLSMLTVALVERIVSGDPRFVSRSAVIFCQVVFFLSV